MEASTTNALISAGGNLAGGLIGMVGQRKREKRAMNNQKQLMDIQARNQKQLNQHGHDLQKDMWDYTNYGNQMKHIKDAGLSAGLIYGGSGAGGSTTGSQSGGSATGGQAPTPQQMPMDIMAGGQALLTAANIELMKSQAKKNEAEADSIRGVEGTQGETQIQEGKTRIDKLIAETKTEEEKRHLTLAQNRLATTQAALAAGQHDKVEQEIRNLQEQLRGIEFNNEVNEATKNEQIDAIGAELMNTLSKTNLQDEQARQIWHSILQQWVAQGMKGLDILVKGRFGDIFGKAKGNVNNNPGQWRKNE